MVVASSDIWQSLYTPGCNELQLVIMMTNDAIRLISSSIGKAFGNAAVVTINVAPIKQANGNDYQSYHIDMHMW